MNFKKSNISFHDLMPYRIHEILLVSSEYDAFILEQDGKFPVKVSWGLNYHEMKDITEKFI